MRLRFMWEFVDGTWIDDEVYDESWVPDDFIWAYVRALEQTELFGTGEMRVISWH